MVKLRAAGKWALKIANYLAPLGLIALTWTEIGLWSAFFIAIWFWRNGPLFSISYNRQYYMIPPPMAVKMMGREDLSPKDTHLN